MPLRQTLIVISGPRKIRERFCLAAEEFIDVAEETEVAGWWFHCFRGAEVPGWTARYLTPIIAASVTIKRRLGGRLICVIHCQSK